MALAGAVPAVLPAGQAPAAHPLVAFRLGSNLWLEDAPFDAMLRFFARQPGAVDELAFFTSATHPPLPLAEMERRAARLGKLLPRVREQGMRAGINVLSTMGHHEENLPFSLSAPWQRVRDAQGRESLGSFCPAQPELIGYARQIYTAMAQAGPDFIWVDDDIRLQGHKPANLTCFCDACVAAFSKHTGTPFTREKLVAAFDAGLLENRLRLRREWLEHNRGVVNTLLRNIEEAVHEVKPGLPLGFMTGDRFYEGYAFERWAGTLAGKAGAPVRWRPGGGFYADESLLGLVDKAHASGRQCSALPAGVTAIQSEVENFPYQRLRKSAHTTAVEAAAHMAAGTTGTAFNVLTMQNDPLDEYGPLFRKLCQYRPFYAKLEAALGRSLALGVWPAWNADSFTTVNADSGWLSGGRMPLNEPCVLGEVGIPICYDQRGAAVTALTGASVLAFPRDELRRMFGGAVLLDVAAWKTLERLQLDSWTGVRGVEPVDHDATEILSAHAVNGRFAGWGRDCRQSFNWERAWNLRPQSAATETLARMVDYGGRDLGVSMTAATNQFGGRVVTMGYYPWSQLHSLAKTSQLKAVCGWLSRGTLPAVAESFAKVVIWCRRGVGGRMALVVLNASLDPVEHLSLRVMTDGAAFTHSQPEAEDRRIAAARIPDAPGAMRVVVPHLEPWSIHLLTAQTA
jgi:hypothetical protein